jgi:16S rRNA (guanine527-N7)-methyltransferase
MSTSTSVEFADLLRRKLAGIATLPDETIAKLWNHYDVLLRWNKRLNLTRIIEPAEAVERHYAESIFVAVNLPTGAWKVADVGSGAGFPGFPIGVMRPECDVTLIESDQRKSVFLKETTRSLANVGVVARRAEEIPGGFDWVVSRAVDPEEVCHLAQKWRARVAFLGSTDGRWLHYLPLPWAPSRSLCFT